jgi:hypothetical protein
MRQSFRTFTAVGAITLLGAVCSYAAGSEVLSAHIPFPFKVGNAVLSPGEYYLRFDQASMPDVLSVWTRDGGEGAFVLTEKADLPRGSGDQPKLIFEKDGGRYLLAGVFNPGNDFGVQIPGTPVAASIERTHQHR